MEVIIEKDASAASVHAANVVEKLVRTKPTAVLGIATGATPRALYAELARRRREESLDFSQVTTFNLDEYVGIPASHPGSCASYTREFVYDPLNINRTHAFIPDGLAKDVTQECIDYEQRIRMHSGVDLQILGVSTLGHIGFNEPSSSLASRTRIKTLTEKTRIDNAYAFPSLQEVPLHALTMGIGTIMEARQIVMLAFGASKADIVRRFVEGPVTAMVPASALQLHAQVIVVLDEAAAGDLEMQNYYRWVARNKPE